MIPAKAITHVADNVHLYIDPTTVPHDATKEVTLDGLSTSILAFWTHLWSEKERGLDALSALSKTTGWRFVTAILAMLIQKAYVHDVSSIVAMYRNMATRAWKHTHHTNEDMCVVMKRLGLDVASMVPVSESERKTVCALVARVPEMRIGMSRTWKIPFYMVPSLVGARACVLHDGDAYLTEAVLQRLSIDLYASGIRRLLMSDRSYAVYTKRDPRLASILRAVKRQIMKHIVPGYDYTKKKDGSVALSKCGTYASIEDLPMCMRRLHLLQHKKYDHRRIYINAMRRIGIPWLRIQHKAQKDVRDAGYSANEQKNVVREMRQLYHKTHKFKYGCSSMRKTFAGPPGKRSCLCPFKQREKCQAVMRTRSAPHSHVLVIHERVNARLAASHTSSSARIKKKRLF